MRRWQWILLRTARQLWFRATLIGALGVAAAGLALLADRFIPGQQQLDVGADAVNSVLSIIASSMLAVTTFSLSVMTSAYGAAASTVTPRATPLLRQDRVTQNVLSTFLGSFLFSIVGIVALKAGAYGPQGRAVLFVVTIGVIVLVVVALLSWIDHLTRLGNVRETTDRVEEATRSALAARLACPFLGGIPRDETATPPPGAVTVRAQVTGYVQHVDMGALDACGARLETPICLAVVPGAFVHEGTPLMVLPHAGAATAEALEETDQKGMAQTLRDAITIGDARSFDQDPRFGLSVLSEIASRALSPAVNDPGTAIDVIGRAARLLTLWAKGHAEDAAEPPCPHVQVPPLLAADLFDDAFRPIARDGAALIEVQLRLRKTLLALAGMGDDAFRAAARATADLALAHAEAALRIEADKRLLRGGAPVGGGR
ncbi:MULTISPECIES: DUF2254 domain-containing protein [unclassified Xanthobacter]|uniref:DUF2254 domain-containing protein n=1 Tax=unclassified Xanthobacter TaxID=2623496 RepID=UPI001EDE8C43|nr:MULTISPECIES: DUF2254 domain-containing protein [unclassified Xanthobacter]